MYTLEFTEKDTEMNISFINWGHFDSTEGTIGWTRGQTTELIMDDVIINQLRLPRPIPTLSEWGIIALAGLLGIIGLVFMRRRNIEA